MTLCFWEDFQAYTECMVSLWKVSFNSDDWTTSTCSCPVFQKQYYCKHWLGVATRKKLIPVSDKTTTISVKPSRGRPFDYESEDLSQRPKGRPALAGAALAIDTQPSTATKRGRGRPKKRALPPTSNVEEIPEAPKRKRGRPRTRPPTSPKLTNATVATITKRTPGRPKKLLINLVLLLLCMICYSFYFDLLLLCKLF